MMKPRISVVVATYNREKPLINTLLMLKKQTVSDFEVIVVDQTLRHDDSTSGELEGILRDKRFRYFALSNPHFTKAKNLGVSEARAKIILNLDDDIEFGEGLLEDHLKNFEDKEVFTVGGKIIDKKTGKIVSGAKIGKFNFSGSFNWVRPDVRTKVKIVGGGNMSFRKDVCERIGGFDEIFFGNAVYEDVDFCLRIDRLGGKILYEPKACVLHLREMGGLRSFGDRLDWFYQLFANYGYFNLKHFGPFYFPLAILKHRRAIGSCLIREGKLSPRAFSAVFSGYKKGWFLYLKSKKCL